jgi:hypothetical protein
MNGGEQAMAFVEVEFKQPTALRFG